MEVYLSDFEEKRKRRRLFFLLTLFLLFIYGALFLGGWIVLYSPLFSIRTIEVRGALRVPREEVLSLTRAATIKGSWWKPFLGYRNILIWPDELTGEDLRFEPKLKAVTLTKDYREGTLTIEVEERKPIGLWCKATRGSEECFWFDDEGILFERSFAAEGNLIRTIHDYSQERVGLLITVLPREFVPNLLSILRLFERVDLSVEEIRLDDLALQEIKVTLHRGPALYFSLRFPAESAAAVIQSLVSKGEFTKLQYVDFRAENRAYYR